MDFNTSDNSYTTVKCVFHDDVVASSALKFDSGYFNCLNESCYESKGEVFDGLIEKELIVCFLKGGAKNAGPVLE